MLLKLLLLLFKFVFVGVVLSVGELLISLLLELPSCEIDDSLTVVVPTEFVIRQLLELLLLFVMFVVDDTIAEFCLVILLVLLLLGLLLLIFEVNLIAVETDACVACCA